ncbi:hypothetical protein U2A4042370260 [Corynebacterium striatum]|nr:hypothetical protein U2A4042370260 [Corynebacterium striatum]
MGKGRLRDFKLGCGGAKVLVFRNGDEGTQLGECRAILSIVHAYNSNIYK